MAFKWICGSKNAFDNSLNVCANCKYCIHLCFIFKIGSLYQTKYLNMFEMSPCVCSSHFLSTNIHPSISGSVELIKACVWFLEPWVLLVIYERGFSKYFCFKTCSQYQLNIWSDLYCNEGLSLILHIDHNERTNYQIVNITWWGQPSNFSRTEIESLHFTWHQKQF